MQPVAVGAGEGVAAGVEAVADDGRGGHGDVGGAEAVQAPGQVVGHGGGGREARHLPLGVHPGVGAAGDGQLDRLAQDGLERGLELSLHRAHPRLPGPAGEPGAVVFDVEPDAAHRAQYAAVRAT